MNDSEVVLSYSIKIRISSISKGMPENYNEEVLNMPCMCWFDPPEESKKLIKNFCQMIVDEIKRLEREGDPIGISIEHTKELLDHLYNPKICSENDKV